ncbi:MAG: M23 family metallopeptidase [Puniceicoccales bacterium]|nr:M23 family metallopeptidase [Puniceicoccales bacterium]
MAWLKKKLTKSLLAPIVILASLPSVARAEKFFLPTPNAAVAEPAIYLQPTAPGMANGGFGLVREGGTRFHAGIDIRPVATSPDGEPVDPIFSVAAGRVVYVNRVADHSDFGIYVLIEHDELSLPATTLYAHLATVRPDIAPGMNMATGEAVGTMGRSGNGCYAIPKEQAHLHFGLGLRLGDGNAFIRWYALQGYGDPNHHGIWNALNMAFIDPLPILQGKTLPLADHLRTLPTAFVTKIFIGQVPPLLLRYPTLWTNRMEADRKNIAGFAVEWDCHGFPKSWTSFPGKGVDRVASVQLLHWQKALLDPALRRKALVRDCDGAVQLGDCTLQTVEKIFGVPTKCIVDSPPNFSKGVDGQER